MDKLLKFSVVGVLNTLITFIIYNLLIYINVNYLIANAIGYVAGTINGFILSSNFVFKKKASVDTGVKFLITNVISFIINSSTLWFFVHLLGANKTLAQIPAIILGFAANFIINKIWTFK
ncbi:GtrA family protein [Clostridium sp. YIM B02551]|uniref:GtrA family protein n=1 Tax=Clostridium sp. YIM B02551 TaxID=2910679 RepID=UPI001EEC622F|nr:GtrA family protein [Clostridium sp. YIM B02551]